MVKKIKSLNVVFGSNTDEITLPISSVALIMAQTENSSLLSFHDGVFDGGIAKGESFCKELFLVLAKQHTKSFGLLNLSTYCISYLDIQYDDGSVDSLMLTDISRNGHKYEITQQKERLLIYFGKGIKKSNQRKLIEYAINAPQ